MLVVSMCMHNKARKYLRVILNKNIVQTFILRSKTLKPVGNTLVLQS